MQRSGDLLFRFRSLDAATKPDADGTFTLLSSCDDPCTFRTDDGPVYEVLNHAPENVDTTSCRSLLLNHDPNQIIGKVVSIDFAGGRSMSKIKISNDAKLATGVKVIDAVRDGSLSGVSIGYNYDIQRDAVWDSKTRTLSVKKWRWAETTLTPIPRDVGAHVMRSIPTTSEPVTKPGEKNAPDITSKERHMDPEIIALMEKHATRAVAIAKRAASGEKAPAIAAWIDAEERSDRLGVEERARADELRTLRLQKEINIIARSHGMDGVAFEACKSIEEATAAMLVAKAKKEQTRSGDLSFRLSASDSGTTVIVDQADKIRDAVQDAILYRTLDDVQIATHDTEDENRKVGPYNKLFKNQGLRFKKFHDLAKLMGRAEGYDDAESWGQTEITRFTMASLSIGRGGLGPKTNGQRASANEGTSLFSNLLINVMDKAMFMGFQGFENITYPLWCKQRQVMDFKQFAGAELTLGNFANIAEGAPLPELAASDVGYKASLGMWGGTLTLTYQSIYNDDLGEFFSNLGKAGMLAKRTIDRNAYITLLGGNWTNDTSAGNTLANSGSLDNVRSDFRHKKNPVQMPIGNNPKYLLHPLSLARPAQQALGQLTPPGEQNYLAGAGVRTMQAIEVVYLDDPTITGNSTTNYYITGDPGMVDTLIIATLQGMPTPQVMEYDAGATVSRKFKMFLPFVPILPTYTEQPSGNVRIPGIQKGTP